MKTNATFARTTGCVVLHPVTLKVRNCAVVQVDGHVHDKRPFGPAQRFSPAGQMPQVGDDPVNLLQVNAPRTKIVGLKVRGDGR